MADFCWDCLADEMYPEHPERNDLAGLCAEDEYVTVLCEGHGLIDVDHKGKRRVCAVGHCTEPTSQGFQMCDHHEYVAVARA